MSTRLYYHLSNLDESDSADIAFDQDGNEVSLRRRVETLEGANLISSLCDDGLHMPVLDVDTMPAWKAVLELVDSWRWTFPSIAPPYVDPDWVDVVDSSTPGHSHIYVNAAMTWENYEPLLDHLRSRHVIEEGYYKAALARKATFVRPPGVLKPAESKRKVRREYRFETEVA